MPYLWESVFAINYDVPVLQQQHGKNCECNRKFQD
jgi:hypothetical protein